MRTYRIDYVVGNTYKNKVVKAETVSEACKKARLNRSIVDIQIIGEEWQAKDKHLLRDF